MTLLVDYCKRVRRSSCSIIDEESRDRIYYGGSKEVKEKNEDKTERKENIKRDWELNDILEMENLLTRFYSITLSPIRKKFRPRNVYCEENKNKKLHNELLVEFANNHCYCLFLDQNICQLFVSCLLQ